MSYSGPRARPRYPWRQRADVRQRREAVRYGLQRAFGLEHTQDIVGGFAGPPEARHRKSTIEKPSSEFFAPGSGVLPPNTMLATCGTPTASAGFAQAPQIPSALPQRSHPRRLRHRRRPAQWRVRNPQLRVRRFGDDLKRLIVTCVDGGFDFLHHLIAGNDFLAAEMAAFLWRYLILEPGCLTLPRAPACEWSELR